MRVTASHLRQDIYRILDQVLNSGKAVEIERRGRILRIVPDRKPDKLAKLKPRKYLKCDPEELVHIDWSGEWRP